MRMNLSTGTLEIRGCENVPETARGRKPPKPQILDNLPRKSGALSLGRRRPTVASTTISHVRRGSFPNREAAAPTPVPLSGYDSRSQRRHIDRLIVYRAIVHRSPMLLP